MADIQQGATIEPFWEYDVPGQLIYQTTFSNPPGLSGFTPLMDAGNSPRPGVVLVNFPAFASTYSMQIVTGPVAGTHKDGFGSAWTRLTRLYDVGRTYGWDAWWSTGSTDNINAPQQIQFGFDTQNRAGSLRWLPQWRYGLINPADGTALNQVLIVNDAGTYVQAKDRVTQLGLAAPYIYNQNKLNMYYMGGRWNATTGYQSATLWDQTIDLTGQTFGAATTGTATFFGGGFNFGASLYNRASTHLASAWLVVGAIRIWVE